MKSILPILLLTTTALAAVDLVTSNAKEIDLPRRPMTLHAGKRISSVDAALSKAKQLVAADRHGEAVKVLQSCREGLPAEAKLNAWRHDFGLRFCKAAIIGDQRVYLLFGRESVPLAAPDTRPVINDTGSRYDFDMTVVCLDAADGHRLWARNTAGAMRMAVDPRTDDLYVWRKSVHRLSPKNGKVLSTLAIPDGSRVHAVLVGGQMLIDQTSYHAPPDMATVCNLSTGQVAKKSLSQHRAMSLNEEWMIEKDRVVATVSKEELWQMDRVPRPQRVSWHGDDLIRLGGRRHDRAIAECRDGATGKLRWRAVLPRGLYDPGHDQLPDGSYAPSGWQPMSVFNAGKNECMLLIGAGGRLFVLDADNGRPISTLSPVQQYMTLPKVVGENLIVASQHEIRAISLDMVFARSTPNEADVILLEADLLTRLGTTADAMELLRHLTEQRTEFAEGWLARGQLAGQLSQRFEMVACLCRYMALCGKTTLPELTAMGLIHRVPTGADILAQPLKIGNRMLVGTCRGDLYEIDDLSGEVLSVKENESAIGALRPTLTINSYAYGVGEWTLPSFKPTFEPTPLDPPASWHSRNGYDGLAIRWRGGYYRPRHKGAVEMMKDGKHQVLKPVVEGIERWGICTSTPEPVGFGNGGVFRLDENLRPVSRIIDMSGADGPKRSVLALASDGKTLGMVVGQSSTGLAVEVWSGDGSKQLRSVSIPFGESSSLRQQRRLLPLGGGYLYAARELTWLSPDEKKPVWQFGYPMNERRRWQKEDLYPRAIPRTDYTHVDRFSEPVVMGDKLLLACRDGGIYVFRTSAIAGD